MTAKQQTAKKPSKFMEPLQVSDDLFAVVKERMLPRTEVQKKLWAYIKAKNLQNPKNMREIIPDEALKKVFGTEKAVSMFEMTRLVNKHLKAKA